MSQGEVLPYRNEELLKEPEIGRQHAMDVEEDARPSSQERLQNGSQPAKKQRVSLSPDKRVQTITTPPMPISLNGSSTIASKATKTPEPQNATSPSYKDLNPQQLKVAERLARQLHELEKKKLEGQKRQRDADEERYRIARDKVEEMRQKLEAEERNSYQSNKEVYALFNDLQGIAKDNSFGYFKNFVCHQFALHSLKFHLLQQIICDLNISFEYPEIVVIGMQSDGKSSFIEGLLGFQFNIVESNIGTRRPLIIQMINDPEKEHPSCRFRREFPLPDADAFEDRDTPVHLLTDEIIRRTNERAGTGSDKVSAVPIILRVQYCYCANLTIYDTPGFRLGGDEKLKNEIRDMVMKLIQPRNRIIVCLEQSTVEWANTVSRPIAREVDPMFERTILVNTKFDNRVKELRNRESAETYLTGEGLPPGCKPFFVSMPVRRNMDSSRFKSAIRDCFLDDYGKLLEIDFDEKFLYQIGLFRVKSHLERLLNEKYQQSMAPTLKALEDICTQTELELSQVNNELQQHNIEILRQKATNYVQAFVMTIDHLLAGSIAGEPDKNGETLNEEKMASGALDWPDYTIDFNIQNSTLRIYGGAQYNRLINEFEYVAHSREFPKVTLSEIAASLGTSRWHGGSERAAANLVQMKAKQVFLPLIDILLQRCSYIMKRLFTIAVMVLKQDKDLKGIGILSVYERFVGELKKTYEAFIDKTENDCRARLKDDFVMFTKIVDWELLSNGNSESADYNLLEASPEETKKRVQNIMERTVSFTRDGMDGVREEEGYKTIAISAAKMFAGIRYFFAKYVRNKMNAFFLDPMLQDIGNSVVNHFYKLDASKYEEMFLDGVAELKLLKTKLEHQLVVCTKQRDRFKEMYYRMKQQAEHH